MESARPNRLRRNSGSGKADGSHRRYGAAGESGSQGRGDEVRQEVLLVRCGRRDHDGRRDRLDDGLHASGHLAVERNARSGSDGDQCDEGGQQLVDSGRDEAEDQAHREQDGTNTDDQAVVLAPAQSGLGRGHTGTVAQTREGSETVLYGSVVRCSRDGERPGRTG